MREWLRPRTGALQVVESRGATFSRGNHGAEQGPPAAMNANASAIATLRRLTTCDTAGCQPALRGQVLVVGGGAWAGVAVYAGLGVFFVGHRS